MAGTNDHGMSRRSPPLEMDWVQKYPVPEGAFHKMQLIVCDKAKDTAEARLLLEALGLVPYLGGKNTRRVGVPPSRAHHQPMTEEAYKARGQKAAATKKRNRELEALNNKGEL